MHHYPCMLEHYKMKKWCGTWNKWNIKNKCWNMKNEEAIPYFRTFPSVCCRQYTFLLGSWRTEIRIWLLPVARYLIVRDKAFSRRNMFTPIIISAYKGGPKHLQQLIKTLLKFWVRYVVMVCMLSIKCTFCAVECVLLLQRWEKISCTHMALLHSFAYTSDPEGLREE